jgi:GT2 family glycosyltransferase
MHRLQASRSKELTWAWCIATYKRHNVLERSTALALSQTIPPSEVIVTDASPDWEVGAARIADLVDRAATAGLPRPRLSYERAEKASLPHQRNQSVSRSTADILVMFDDDTLMFPDTAQKILEIYSLDEHEIIQAVTAVQKLEPPPPPAWISKTDILSAGGETNSIHPIDLPKKSRSRLAEFVRSMLRATDRFAPYDPVPPSHPIPSFLAGKDVNSWKAAAGYCLTVRRTAAMREPFDGRLVGYSPTEDTDMTYRLTRHGPIIANHQAFIYHLESPGSRFGLQKRTALGAINPLLFHRVHSPDLAYSERANRVLLRRRLLIELAKDLSSRDLHLPRARGIADALRQVRYIMRSEDDEINNLFQRYQVL